MLLIRNKAVRQAAGVLETVNWLTLKLFLKNPRAMRVFPGKVYRDYMSLVGEEKWACKSVFDLLGGAEPVRITLEHLPGAGIYAPIDELAYMALVARHLAPKHVFEIGTFRGRTALNFALNTPDDCRIYTLDLPPEDRQRFVGTEDPNAADTKIIALSETGVDYRGKDVAHKIEQLFGDSTQFDFAPYHGRMDLVFVDGAHHYAAVKADTENALRMVRPGGVILWHDWGNYGDYNDVVRAVLDTLPGQEVVQIDNTQLAFYRKP